MCSTKNYLLPKLITKLIAILMTSQKTESSNNDTNCFEKTLGHSLITRNWCLQQTKVLILTTQKGVLDEWKKDLEKSLKR